MGQMNIVYSPAVISFHDLHKRRSSTLWLDPPAPVSMSPYKLLYYCNALRIIRQVVRQQPREDFRIQRMARNAIIDLRNRQCRVVAEVDNPLYQVQVLRHDPADSDSW